MRRHLRMLVAATTSAVVLAFLIPLVVLVHQQADERAHTEAYQVAQAVAMRLGLEDTAAVVADVQPRTQVLVGVVLPDGGGTVGHVVDGDDADVEAARAESRFVQRGDLTAEYVPALVDGRSYVVRVVIPESVSNQGVWRATVTIAALGLLLLGLALLVADRLARTVSRPFDQLADAADAMREGDLALRVPEDGLPEAAALGRALNRLAARVEELLVAEREVVADLSHRLRTPVTALRLDAEGVDDPEVAERLRQHVAHLERSIDLVVADARRPVRSVVGASCDVAAVVRERVAFWAPLAEDQGRALDLMAPPRAVAGIEARELVDVVDVLVDNVFAHTPEGTALRVRVEQEGHGVALTVEDGGPGLPDRHVVERGSSGAGSTGLGLDIARRAAEASGGELALGRSSLGGACVRVLLGAARL